MKFHLDNSEGLNLFSSYDAEHVAINKQRYPAQPMLVTPDSIYTDWPATNFASLCPAHFEYLLTLEPELVLLGTGNKILFPHPSLFAALIQRNIGLEVMDNQAACRTYNILASEGRRIVVALLAST